MTTPYEDFVNIALGKSVSSDVTLPTADDIPVFTGIGRQVTGKTATELGLATTEYTDAAITKVWKDQGNYDVSITGAWPTSTNTVGAVPIKAGFLWVVTNAGTGTTLTGSVVVSNGDTLRALIDDAGNNAAHWGANEANLGYTPENQNNKDTDGTLAANSDTKYPSQKAVKTYADNYDISAASISSTGMVTLTRTESNLTFQVPTAISGLSFNASTGVLTSSYTNSAVDTTITVAANEVSDNVFRIKDNVDTTKKIAFQASSITTDQTRTITMPDVDVDLGKVPTNLAYDSATAVLTQTLTDATSLSADLSAIAVNQVALTGGSTVTVTGTQSSTKYFLAGSTVSTFDVTAFTNTGKFIEIVNNTGGYATITLTATGRNFIDEVGDLVTFHVWLVRGESLFVFPVNATTLQVYRNKPDIRNIKNNANIITSGFKTTNLFVDSSTTVGQIAYSGDELVRIFALAQATLSFGYPVYDARTDTQISTGSYTMYAGQVIEATKTSLLKWVILGGHTNSTVAPSGITVTASPMTYQNTTGYEADVIISGGTVSNIEFTRNNTTFYTVGFIEGFLRLSPSDRVRVTYTVAPTMTLVPR